jgi:hypothetical protein
MAKAASIFKNKAVIYGGLILGGYYLILKPILEGLNLKDTREEKEAAQLQNKTENLDLSKDYWNPNWFASGAGKYTVALLPEEIAKAYVKRLKNAEGYVNDDEEAIFAVFRLLKAKSQVSWLAYWFNKQYKKDLYTWLRDAVLNEKELNTVLNIIGKLPTGFTKK